MPTETEEMKGAAQALVDHLASIEVRAAQLIADTAATVPLMDKAARLYNAAGYDVRACALGSEAETFSTAARHFGRGAHSVSIGHCNLIGIAITAGIPLPAPGETEGGGR